jgi:hypothetical protein
MTSTYGILQTATSRPNKALLALLCLHVAACCVSLYYVAYHYRYGVLDFVPAQLVPSLLIVAPVAVLALAFVVARFSFGYILGFGFYTMILGYIWLSKWSVLDYDHAVGSLSAFASAVAFLVPALAITAPVRQRMVLPEAWLDHVLTAVLLLAALTIGLSALYNFKIVSLDDIYEYRQQVELPAPLRYAIGNFVGALLPFAFACHCVRRQPLRAAAALVLLLLFYPITLTKLALFAPFWLLFLAMLGYLFEARIAVVLSLLTGMLIGDGLALLSAAGLLPKEQILKYFGIINFRMMAVPSIALDLYSDFFSRHGLTHFCQISFLKSLVACPYDVPPWVLMNNNYQLGSVNASLFATEGVASVGLKWAALPALACGLVVGLVNRLSSGLPALFILVSSGVVTQALMNVPFATTLLSNGGALLFLLWYVTPREMFASPVPAAGHHAPAIKD